MINVREEALKEAKTKQLQFALKNYQPLPAELLVENVQDLVSNLGEIRAGYTGKGVYLPSAHFRAVGGKAVQLHDESGKVDVLVLSNNFKYGKFNPDGSLWVNDEMEREYFNIIMKVPQKGPLYVEDFQIHPNARRSQNMKNARQRLNDFIPDIVQRLGLAG